MRGCSSHESSSPMWKSVWCWIGPLELGPNVVPRCPFDSLALVIAGNWTRSSTMRQSWITRLGGMKAASWWPSEVDTSLPPPVMELLSRRVPLGRGRLTWPCSSLWVMVRPWVTPYLGGPWALYTLSVYQLAIQWIFAWGVCSLNVFIECLSHGTLAIWVAYNGNQF